MTYQMKLEQKLIKSELSMKEKSELISFIRRLITATWFMFLILLGTVFTLPNCSGYIKDGKQKLANCLCKLRLSAVNKWTTLFTQPNLT